MASQPRWSESRKCWVYVDGNGHRRYVSAADSASRDSGQRQHQSSSSITSGSPQSYGGPSSIPGLEQAMDQISISKDASPFQVRRVYFFQPGRVFATERQSHPSDWNSRSTAVLEIPAVENTAHGFRGTGQIYVVVSANAGQSSGHCYCLLVHTYNRLGVAKDGVVKGDHGIIYSGKREPEPEDDEEPIRGEEGMCAVALRVEMRLPDEKLDPMSRINYKSARPFSKSVPVHNLGFLHKDSMPWLAGQYQAVQRRYRHSKAPVEDDAEDSDNDGADEDQTEERNPPPTESTDMATEAAQAKEAYRRMRDKGYSRDQAVGAVASILRKKNPQLSLEGSMAAARGRLRYGPNPINV
ncbi:hypothetical protein HII31_13128 [Pseudocercospora fuligena]|uniref:DUF6590 domain-containing protein n=1 Tax=Pseudocercospora fuligena TaxID=685502 RepID=A0A8H6VES2_9PEZI|nr:hypothetical protein HII31_13128 [Pseudocercospora fuligena]